MKLIEKRQLYSFELKRLCAKNRLFNLGSGKEYEILLGMTIDENGNMKNLSTQDIQRIAEFLISRSELPSGISLTHVACVINHACTIDFKLVEAEEELEGLQSQFPILHEEIHTRKEYIALLELLRDLPPEPKRAVLGVLSMLMQALQAPSVRQGKEVMG